jgi:aminoglycoside phosphotransferase (APT) family kinase protein
MEKVINELTYKVEGRLVKLCWEVEKNRKRIERAELLKGLVPELVYKGDHATAYEWVEGKPLAQANDVGVFARFLDWCQEMLWTDLYDVPNWQLATLHFYKDKTYDRIWQYLGNYRRSFCSSAVTVNGQVCQPVMSLYWKIDWHWLLVPRLVRFHGDLQFDNALLSDQGRFVLIDWRECFGDSPLYGDVYYDLAKLYNDLDLPYDLIKRRQFELCWDNLGRVKYSYQIPSNLNNFRVYYERWLGQHGYDLQKVKLLAALVPLNMAPLHPEPFRDLLFFHSLQRLNALLG